MTIIRQIGKKDDWVKQRMLYTSGKTAEIEYCSQERMRAVTERAISDKQRKKKPCIFQKYHKELLVKLEHYPGSCQQQFQRGEVNLCITISLLLAMIIHQVQSPFPLAPFQEALWSRLDYISSSGSSCHHSSWKGFFHNQLMRTYTFLYFLGEGQRGEGCFYHKTLSSFR